MTYGLSTGLFVENGPAVRAAQAIRASSAAAHQSLWQSLKRDERLALVERTLRGAA